jgi:pyruvate/2-oxoglutarate/acetoin dehydrogenase E1 component
MGDFGMTSTSERGCGKETFVSGLNQALHFEMQNDPSVLVLGEDIGRLGGLFRVTDGLAEAFPGRVYDTPISEGGFAGMGVGAAIAGHHVVVELQVFDFIWLAADQVANAAMMHFVSGGQVSVPIVFRGPCGFGTGFGVTHTQHLEAVFCSRPGLKVVYPSTPWDAKGLLTSAIRDPNPVIFIEESTLYYQKGPLPEDGESIPLGSARVVVEGEDLTIISAGRALAVCEEAIGELESLGIAAELIDLRSLKPLDLATLCTSVQKTGYAICALDGPAMYSFSSMLTGMITEHCWASLKGPPTVVGGLDIAGPVAQPAEQHLGVRPESVVEAATCLVHNRG